VITRFFHVSFFKKGKSDFEIELEIIVEFPVSYKEAV